MLTLGIDPDLHRLAMAWVNNGELWHARTVRVPASSKGNEAVESMVSSLANLALAAPQPERVAVESQRLVARAGRRHSRPDDIVRLAQVAGAALLWARMRWPTAEVELVQPAAWKGQVAKAASQARILTSLGLDYEMRGSGTSRYSIPTNPPRALTEALTASDWKHVVDAAGLAAWVAQDEPRRPV